MKKNNTAEKTVQDAKNIVEALKESTKQSLKDIMNEAIENVIMGNDDTDDNEEEAEEIEKFDNGDDLEDSFEVEDVDTDGATEDKTHDEGEGDAADADAEEGSDMEEFKVEDGVYDFRGADEDKVLEVFNSLGDDDQIVVKKNEDGTYDIKDEETNAEYEIETDDAETDEAEPESADTDDDIEDSELEIELDGENAPEEKDGDNDEEISIEVDGNDEEDEDLNEDANFVVNDYQKKDAIEGLNVNEPANKKDTYSMDAGAPKGTERPYGKKGDGQPFEQNVNEACKEGCEDGKGECNECGDVAASEPMIDEDGTGLNTKHSTKKSTNHINRDAQQQHNVSTDGKFQALKEHAQKIYEKAKLIQEENNKYKDSINEIKKSLQEAAVLNVSLAQVVKLIMENSTTAKEKKSILQRFNNVKTIQESKSLYNTIKMELNEAKRSEVILEKEISAVPEKEALNETAIYKKENPSLDLMRRMDNLWK